MARKLTAVKSRNEVCHWPIVGDPVMTGSPSYHVWPWPFSFFNK